MAKFAKIKAKAEKNRKEIPPFVLEDVDPPIEITQWVELERDVGLSELIAPDGTFQRKDQRKILEYFCGDAFPQVWELCRKEHASVMTELVEELIQHFRRDIDGQEPNESGDDKPADESAAA